MKKFRKPQPLILIAIVSYYLIWELRAITLPPLMTDEGWLACISYKTINNLFQHDCTPYYVTILGRWVPVMSLPYHGVAMTYFLIPFLLLGGLNVLTIRLFSITVGLITILLLYFFCKRFLNKKAALIISSLLAIDWAFILETKIGLVWGTMMYISQIGSLLCFLEWYKRQRRFYFFIGSFLLGLGICVVGVFVYFVIALAIYFVIFITFIKKDFLKQGIIPSLIIGVVGFCLGASPLICYEIKNQFAIVRYVLEHFFETQNVGINNLQYMNHLLHRTRQFIELPSVFLNEQINGFNNKGAHLVSKIMMQFYFYLFSLSIICHLLSIIFKKGSFQEQKRIMLIIFFVMFLQIPFTLSDFKHGHLLIFLPITKILMGIFLFELMNLSKGVRTAMKAIPLGLFIMHSYGLMNYYAILDKTGAAGGSSDAIYRVVDYLVSKKIKDVVLMDSQLCHIISVASGGSVNEKNFDFIDWAGQIPFLVKLKEMGGKSKNKDNIASGSIANERYYDSLEAAGVKAFRVKFIQKVGEELENSENVYLFRSSEYSFVKCFDLFAKLAQQKDKEVKERARFYRRDGKLMFLLYEVI